MEMNDIFRRGGGGEDEGRGRLRRPLALECLRIVPATGNGGRRKRPLPAPPPGPRPYGTAAVVLVMIVVTLASIAYLLFPGAGAARADGGAPNLAYISGTTKGISVVDIQQKAVTNTFSLAGDPQTIFLSLDGRFLYVTQPQLNRVTALTARTGQSFCSASVPGQPSLLAFDQSANILYVAGNAAASVTAIDPGNCAIKKTLRTSGPVSGLAVANIGGSNGNQVWVSVPSGLQVFDNRGLIASIAIPGGAQYISIPPGVTVYVVSKNGKLYPVSLSTQQVLSPVLSGGQFGPMDYDMQTDEIYVPDMLNKRVDVLNPIVSTTPPFPTEPARVISLGVAPQSIAITSDGQFGFIALAGGNVAMLDVPGKEVFDTLFVGGNPRFIITGLYPPLLGNTPSDVSFWSTIVNILAYALIFVLLIVPAVFFLRRARVKPEKK